MTTPDAAEDLDRTVLDELLGDRPLRTFAAMMSTEAEALRWARQGGVAGSVVVAAYQASPRGRSGLSYASSFVPGRGFGFSVIARPDLSEEREGWLYTAALLGVDDALSSAERSDHGVAARLAWPDRVLEGDDTVAGIGVHAEPGGRGRVAWAVITVLLPRVTRPRGPLLRAVLDAVDARLVEDAAEVLDDYRARCSTLGRRVEAQILPMGPASPAFVGVAEDVVDDGGLRITTDDGARVVVRPQSLGFLEAPESGPMGPPGLG